MSAAATTTGGLDDHQKEGVRKFQDLREEIDDLQSKLGQLESDKNEHEYVKQISTF